MKKKVIATILTGMMAVSLFAGCGKKAEEEKKATEAATEAVAEAVVEEAVTEAVVEEAVTEAVVEAAVGGNFAKVPAMPDTEGKTSNEWLITRTDKIPLSGVVSNHFDSRASVAKAVDKLAAKSGKDKIKIACMMASQGTQFFTTLSAAVQEKCDEYGYEVTFFDANFDLGAQQTQYEQVLAGDYDYIICNAVDIDATADAYRQSVEKGIPVTVTGPTAAKDEYQITTTILSGSWAAGEATGEYTAEYVYKNMGFDGTALKWGAVVDKMGDADSESRPCGFIAGYLLKYDELTGQNTYKDKWDAGVVAYNIWTELRDKGSYTIDGILDLKQVVCTENIATSAAQPKCAELLAANPDLDIAFVETDSFGLAMVTELYQQGKKPGEDILVVYAADGTGELCQAIKKGEVLCIAVNCPTYNGYGAVDICKYILEGTKDCNDLPANSFTPTYCVTPDNVGKVYKEGNLYADPMEWNIQTTNEYNEANK